MSTAINVVRRMQQANTALSCAGLGAQNIFRLELEEAIEAVKELIDADEEYDAARLWLRVEETESEGGSATADSLQRANSRFRDASARRRDALARVKGVAA